MAKVDVNGVKLHVQRVGKGPPVVMLHGLFSTLTSWYTTVAPILAPDHDCIMYDLRGHGGSERVVKGYDLRTLANDLLSLLNELGLEKVPLLGHSYGALVGLRLAIAHPERVSHLILVEAPLPPSKADEIEDFMAKTPAEMLAALPPVAQTFIVEGGRRARGFLRSVIFLARESSLLSDMRAEPDFTDEELAGVQCPTLCIYGAESCCLDASLRLGRTVPRSATEVLPGGHSLHLDSPSVLAAKILEFLDGI